MGIDGGTGGIRVGLYDETGNCLSFASKEYPTDFPQPGFAQQDPQEWWKALRIAIQKALEKGNILPEQVCALACDTTCTSVVLCKKDGTPVYPCILWMDVRAGKEAEELYEKTGEFYSPEWMPPKLAWLKRNERMIYEEADVFCEYQDWLTYKLTGNWCMNNNTACNWAFSIRDDFSRKIYQALDIEDALNKFPTEQVYRVGDPVGYLSKEAAAYLQLPQGLPIAQGGIDSSIGLLGMGINKPGKIGMITGSSNLAMTLNTVSILNPNGSNNGPDNLLPGYYTDYVAQSSTGSILSWYRKQFCEDLSYQELDALAKEIPIGSNGVLLLDYFQGNKHPYYDSRTRGMFYGLTLSHTKADLYRSILEGVAFGTERMLDSFREKGVEITEMSIAGGSSRSPLWMQIHADVSNIRINVPKDKNAPNLGCAIACAKMLGIYPSLADAVDHMVTYEGTYLPIKENHEKYQKICELYKSFYPTTKDWMHQFSDLFNQ